MNKDNTKANPKANTNPNPKANTNPNTDSNAFKVPPVGSYIPKKTPEQIHNDLLKSFGHNNNGGQQK